MRDQLEGRPEVEVFLPPLGAPGVVDLVGMKGQPEPVPDAEIEAVRSLVESTLRYDPYPYGPPGAVRQPDPPVRGGGDRRR